MHALQVDKLNGCKRLGCASSGHMSACMRGHPSATFSQSSMATGMKSWCQNSEALPIITSSLLMMS
eukprot:jgi/Mesvir1/5424/Mv25560-RA.1